MIYETKCSSFFTGNIIYSDSWVFNIEVIHNDSGRGCHISTKDGDGQWVQINQCPYKNSKDTYDNHCPLLNRLAKIPILNILSGLTRVVLAIVHIVLHLFATLIYWNKDHLVHAAKGGFELVRGGIEAMPFVGNIFAWTYDPAYLFDFLSQPPCRASAFTLDDADCSARIETAKYQFFGLRICQDLNRDPLLEVQLAQQHMEID